ncbi:Rrf2 family transcriptional regulator, partial [bacterium]|nr:Rrf2 family transcriptional regulator [bacterium]
IAVHSLLAIEFYSERQKVTADFLASSTGVNPVIIRNVLAQLKAVGLVEIMPGVGGTKLKKSIDEISLLDVFQAVETEENLFHLHEKPNPDCQIGKNIHRVLNEELKKIQDAVKNKMKKITLRKMFENSLQNQSSETNPSSS